MIEPGEKFAIEYGNGKQLDVVCLAGRKQSRIMKLLSDIQKAEKENTLGNLGDLFLECLVICTGDEAKANDLFENSVNYEMIGDIVSKTTAKQTLTEDDAKK